MRSGNPIVAALIAALPVALPAPNARAEVEMTVANADERLGQAETAFKAGRRKEAERLLREVTGWANHLRDPAGVGHEAARAAKSEVLYQRLLATIGRTFGADDEHAWHPLMGLADLYRKQRRFAEAESLLGRALSIAQNSQGPVGERFYAEGTVVSALATLYEEQGRTAEAEASFRHAADLFDVASPAPARQKRDEVLLKCALMLRAGGRRAEAAELEARMLPENRAKVPEIEARRAWDAAIAETRAGRIADAERIYKGVVRDAEARGDPILGQAVSALARFYFGAGDEAQIRILCERYASLLGAPLCRSDDRPPPVPTKERPLDNETINAGRNPDDPRIRALVAYLETRAFTLVHTGNGNWLVSAREMPGWEKVVHIRSFPAEATEDQMRGALQRISLAYRLNPRAHIAMSYFDYQGSDRDPRTGEPVRNEQADAWSRLARNLAELFLQYTP